MLFLENMNLEILVLLAGLYKDVNILAAQVVLVSFGSLLDPSKMDSEKLKVIVNAFR